MSKLRERASTSWQSECDETPVLKDPLSLIYNEGNWKLNRVSPLYNLQYSVVKLKQYGLKIRQSVVSSVADNASMKYSVKLEPADYLKYSEDEPDGVVITISSTQEKTNKAKVAYQAILLSWGVSSKLSGAIHLPYMLERGEQRLGSAVKATLQSVFDCNIKQFSFTEYQILQFGLSFLDEDTSRDHDQFKFVFKTANADVKDKFIVSLDLVDMKLIWKVVKDMNTSELVYPALQSIRNLLFHCSAIDISMLDICEILLPTAEVKGSGIVKMKSAEMVNCVFVILNKICDSIYSHTASVDC